ncbi:hypothetical protein NDU88_003508 [Pleurodeles waltl]|uniref:Uncharacterized protein n=1 Tax=Pleurodeles waltl TaxID=8319 RepID=A0AAV7V1Y5_PLEWA|nr:hypothetical protein NDU88_003508 [Pleurodeles waltl]
METRSLLQALPPRRIKLHFDSYLQIRSGSAAKPHQAGAGYPLSSKLVVCSTSEIRKTQQSEMSASSRSSQGTVPPHDMKSQSQLTSLYTQPVVFAELLTRPMGSLPVKVGPISHSGVRVTLADGRKYLVHKGENYGISSQTVVVDARHMGSDWKITQAKPVQGKTVSDFVRAGGKGYHILFNNCHMGSARMMK